MSSSHHEGLILKYVHVVELGFIEAYIIEATIYVFRKKIFKKNPIIFPWNLPFDTCKNRILQQHFIFTDYQLNDKVGYIEYFDGNETGTFIRTWTVEPGLHEVIQLAFTYLDIPTRQQCTDNHLGVGGNYSLHAQLCSAKANPEVTWRPFDIRLLLNFGREVI